MSGNIVLGSYDQVPGYVGLARAIGANVFRPSELQWSFLERFSDTWTANKSFLDASISRSRTICLLTPPIAAVPGSAYCTELQYLKQRGVPASHFRLLDRSSIPVTQQARDRRSGSYRRWLRWNELLASKHEQHLTQAVQENLSFLFSKHGGQVLPGDDIPFPPGFDYAFLTMAVEDIQVRFVRGRGDFTMQVAPQHTPRDFYEVSLVLMANDSPQGICPRVSYLSFYDAARLLKNQWDRLKEALSKGRYDIVQRRLFEISAIPVAEQLRAIS